MSPSDVFDLIAFGIVAAGCLFGLFRGLSGELARIAAIVGAFLSCRFLGPVWKSLCASWFGDSGFLFALMAVVGFLVLATLAGWLVRKVVDKCLRVLVPQPANAVLGGVFGAIAAFLLAAIVCSLIHLIPLDFVQDSLLGSSRFWKLVLHLHPMAGGAWVS